MTGLVQHQLELPGLDIVPTIAMQRGEQHAAQWAQCGLLIVATGLIRGLSGACSVCGRRHSWAHTLPVGGVRHAGPCCDVTDVCREQKGR